MFIQKSNINKYANFSCVNVIVLFSKKGEKNRIKKINNVRK